jgi:hypothetical protein
MGKKIVMAALLLVMLAVGAWGEEIPNNVLSFRVGNLWGLVSGDGIFGVEGATYLTNSIAVASFVDFQSYREAYTSFVGFGLRYNIIGNMNASGFFIFGYPGMIKAYTKNAGDPAFAVLTGIGYQKSWGHFYLGAEVPFMFAPKTQVYGLYGGVVLIGYSYSVQSWWMTR